jgi:hypothetical protein
MKVILSCVDGSNMNVNQELLCLKELLARDLAVFEKGPTFLDGFRRNVLVYENL